MAMHPLEPSFLLSLWSRQENEDGFLPLQENTTPRTPCSCCKRIWGESSAGGVTLLLVGRFRCQMSGEALQPQPGQRARRAGLGLAPASSRLRGLAAGLQPCGAAWRKRQRDRVGFAWLARRHVRSGITLSLSG